MLTSSSGLFRGELRQDNGRVWSTTGKRHTGFYKIQCRYCNSQLIIKNGKRINTYQRCYACNYIFSIPTINFRQSSLPRVCCPKCKIFNEVTLVQNWRCTECNRTFYNEDRISKITFTQANQSSHISHVSHSKVSEIADANQSGNGIVPDGDRLKNKITSNELR